MRYRFNKKNIKKRLSFNMSEFVYHSLAIPVLVYDSNKKLQNLNDTAITFFNIDSATDNISNTSIDHLFDLAEDVFSFKEDTFEIDAICQRNYIYCNLSINKSFDNRNNIISYIILVTDLTERIKEMQDLEKAIVEAECANRAKTTFLSHMSHEIRTPMNAIIVFSELLLKMNISPEVREYVQDIKWSSNNLLAIINDILDISKIESGKMELVCNDFHLGGLLGDVSLIIHSQAKKKGLNFTMNVDSTTPNKVHGDKIRLRAVLINILNNAIKYTQKGDVSFDIHVKELNDDSVNLEFIISDTGVGIKTEDIPSLFQPFEQIDQKVHYGTEGSGLGLAIVNGYVKLMNGTISVDSTYGEGSVFTVSLTLKMIDRTPINTNFSMEETLTSSSNISNLKISGIKVLVVDDNLVNLKVASSSFNHYNLTVDTASSGFDALELCKTNEYPLVFLDHMMPEMDGVETQKKLRQLNPYYAAGGKSKIIVLTANAISGIREQLLAEGFDEYLGKPINFNQLERLFKRLLPAECIYYESEEDTSNQTASSLPAADLEYLKKTLLNVDVDYGLSNCGNTLNDYLEVLKLAWNYGENQLNELQTLHQQKDYETYTIKVHSMKSMTKNLGAISVSDMAKAQEEAGKTGNIAFIDSHIEELQTAYLGILKSIHTVLSHYEILPEESSDTKESTEEGLNNDTMRLILQNIRQHANDFEFIAIFDILENIQKNPLSEAYSSIFAQIAEYMDDLEIEKLDAFIEEILNTLSAPCAALAIPQKP